MDNHDQESAHNELPPLRIHHLMLLTAVTAVSLALCQIRGLGDSNPSVWMAGWVVFPISSAAAITALGLRFVWRRLRHRWLATPGDGLALLVALQFLLIVPSFLIQSYLTEPGARFLELWSLLQFWLQYGHLIMGLVHGALCLAFAICLADSGWWRAFFIVKPLVGMIRSGAVMVIAHDAGVEFFQGAWYPVVIYAPSLVWFTLLAMACWNDHHQHHQRHWTHWWGVLAMALPAMVTLIATVGFLLLPPESAPTG